MTRLKDSIPLMEEHELNEWAGELMLNVNRLDLEGLAIKLEKEFRLYRLEKLSQTDFKMCDKCEATYPRHTTECHYCAGKLRVFRNVAAQVELEKEKEKDV